MNKIEYVIMFVAVHWVTNVNLKGDYNFMNMYTFMDDINVFREYDDALAFAKAMAKDYDAKHVKVVINEQQKRDVAMVSWRNGQTTHKVIIRKVNVDKPTN